MKKMENMKRLISNLLTVYSGTTQNTSPNEKIFPKAPQSSEDIILSQEPNNIDAKPSEQNKAKITKSKDTITLNIEDIILSLHRGALEQDSGEVSIILPKTELKKTYYNNEKIATVTEIVLSNLTIIHNPKGGPQIISTNNSGDEKIQDQPKLKIGFNTEEFEKTTP